MLSADLPRWKPVGLCRSCLGQGGQGAPCFHSSTWVREQSFQRARKWGSVTMLEEQMHCWHLRKWKK